MLPISKRENFLMAFAEHKMPYFVPQHGDTGRAGGALETWENGPRGGGYDAFGVLWDASESASGAGVPAAGHIVLDDICDWEDKVKFPDLDAIDWNAFAEKTLANYNRDEKVLEYGCWNGQFLRTTHLMGFENALVSMISDEDAYAALLKAITDYRIRSLERIYEYFHPDIVTLYIDVATERGLFMSHEMYRKLISPGQKRFVDAAKSYGMMASVHCCGKAESLIEDFIAEGFVNWSSVQPTNDIKGLLQKYGDKISISGGFDSNGKPGQPDATDAEVEAEVKRCLDEYASEGSFILSAIRMLPGVPREIANAAIKSAYEKYAPNYNQFY